MRWTEWAVSIAGGLLIVAVLLFGVVLPWLQPSTQTTRGESPAAAPPEPMPSPAQAPLASPEPKTRLSLDELQRRCVAEVRGLRERPVGPSACDQFAEQSRRQLPAPQAVRPPPPPSRSNGPAPRKAESPRTPAVTVEECERHRYGSIAYRSCRKEEWKRLKQWCFDLREALNTEQGRRLKHAQTWVGPVCEAYERYQIVK